MTYFMTPKVTVTFVVVLTQFMTPRGHGVTRGQLDLLYDPLTFDLDLDLKVKHERGTNKSHEPRSGSRSICLFRATNHSS